MILRSLDFSNSPALHLNISGAELISVREIAEQFGNLMNKKVIFTRQEAETALLVDVSKGHSLLGKPNVKLDQLIKWTAIWVANDHRLLGKSTHFEVRDGKY